MANTAKLELTTVLVPRRGRGGNGKSQEVQVLGLPVYPKGQKGEKIAESIDVSGFKGFNVEEMTKFVSGLGFDICVLAAEALNSENRSADKRSEHELKTKGNMLIALGFATDKNYSAKVKSMQDFADFSGITFEQAVEKATELKNKK